MSSIKPEKLLPPTPDVLLSAAEAVRRRRDPNWGRDEGEIRPESPTGGLLLIEAANAAIEARPPAGTARPTPGRATSQAMLVPQRTSTVSGHARGASGWSLSSVGSGPPQLDEESLASLRDSFNSVQSVKMVVWEVQEQHG